MYFFQIIKFPPTLHNFLFTNFFVFYLVLIVPPDKLWDGVDGLRENVGRDTGGQQYILQVTQNTSLQSTNQL